MRLSMVLGVALMGVLGWQAQADDPKSDGKSDPTELIGRYQVVSAQRSGQPIPPGGLHDVTVRIAANAITNYDKDNKQVYAATYKLDTSHKPWRITMTAIVVPEGGKGTHAEGLIAKEGDIVKLIYALPGGKAPTDFKTAQGQQMFILKRTGD